HNQFGVTYLAKVDPERSLQHYDKALELQPSLAEAHNNRGAALQVLGRHCESRSTFETALRLKPDFAVARLNYALASLSEGDFATGWREFEWRFLCPDFRMKRSALPRWTGESLEGKSILLRAEQGLGDTIQFIRYAPLLKAQGGRVIVECQAAL